MKFYKKGSSDNNWLESKYARKSQAERDTIVWYFTNHPIFGSTEWFDSDKVLHTRNRVNGNRLYSNPTKAIGRNVERVGRGRKNRNSVPFRCSDCKKAWQRVDETYNKGISYLAKSIWKNIPLDDRRCPNCE
jgi:hypothetical protein|tara:strand:+ start:1410 stop:1805 length:396 start_codon:yes stop_codon:yes gene_type:complete